jgi:signal transduction histidine kinase
MVQDRVEEKRIAVIKNYDRKLPRVPLDLVRMMQVFTNLYLNAIQALAPGGKLKVSSGLAREQEKSYLRITVTDNGAGISVAQRSSIFEPFYTTKSNGTGLGLTVVRKIVEQHNGKVQVESQVGQYTRFTVLLPLKTGSTA